MSGQKFYATPFAQTGDRVAIPNPVQGTGAVSYTQGFGPDYERDPATDVLAKRIPRDKTNSLYFELTDNIREYQLAGFPEWVTAAQNGAVAVAYPLNAYIRWNGGSGADWEVYAALVDGATAEPGTDPAQWALVSPASIAAFKASQTQTNQGTGLLLTGAAEVVKAAREGRWAYMGAAAYATASALTVAIPGGVAYTQGLGSRAAFTVPTANTVGGLTLQVGGGAAVALKTNSGDALATGDLQPGAIYDVTHTGTEWRIDGPVLSQLARYASAGDGSIFGYIATNTPGALATQVTLGVGNCRDATNARSIPRLAPMTKSISAVWAAGNGNGGRDQAGAFPASSTVHVHAILNDATGATDLLLSLSVAAPTLPIGWAFSRRVFSFLLDAASVIREWLHVGDWVGLKVRGVEWAATTNGVAAGTLRNVGVPTGVKVNARFYYQSQNVGGSNPNPALSGIYDPDMGAVPVFGGATQWAQIRTSWDEVDERYQTVVCEQWTNTNGQVYTASNDTGDNIAGGVLGWWDYRGRFF